MNCQINKSRCHVYPWSKVNEAKSKEFNFFDIQDISDIRVSLLHRKIESWQFPKVEFSIKHKRRYV